MLSKIKNIVEVNAFGVCTWIGQKIGVSTPRIRLAFIYLSFITLGSPLLIYLVMAFIIENKHYFKFKAKRNSVWEIYD